MQELLLNNVSGKKFYDLDGMFGIDETRENKNIFKVPKYTRQFEHRTIDRPRLGSSPEVESITSSIKYSTATGKSIAS